MTEALVGFAEHLRAEKKAPPTQKSYPREVRYVLDWLGSHLGRVATLADLSAEHLQAYQRACAHKSGQTIRKFISALRAFCDFLGLEPNPARRMRRPKVAQRQPKVLTEAESARLCDAPLTSQPEGAYRRRRAALGWPVRPHRQLKITRVLRLRDAAALEIWNAGGLRLGELRDLQISDLCFGRDVHGREQVLLSVHGKGSKDRRVPLQGQALAAIRAYLDRRAELRPRCDSFLISTKTGLMLRDGSMREIVLRWGAAVGIKCHPHLLRHTCATEMARQGAKPVLIKELLGHASLATTSIYIHMAGCELGPGCAAKHPRGRAAPPQPSTEGAREIIERIAELPAADLVHVTQALLGRISLVGLPAP